ncbi:MAG: TolC family protein [Prevotella sp.]|nr:TolC family protein [Prevotella sp.]
MKKRRIIYWMTLLLLPAMPLQAQRQWTLDDCISHAMQHNITLQKSKLQLQSASEDVKAQKGALLPTLSASTNHSIGYQPWKDNGIATVTNGQVNTKVDKTYYNGSYGLNAQWTVWNGGRNRNNVRMSELSEQQAELSVSEQANSIEERICQLYTQCLYMREAIRVDSAMLQTSLKNENRGKEMVEAGLLAKADLAQLTSQRASDEYNLVEGWSQLENYMLQLRQLLELKANDQFDIADTEGTDAQALAPTPSLVDIYEQALEQRPEIKSRQIGIESANVQLAIAKAGHMPTIAVTGGASTNTNSLSNNGWGNQMKTNFGLTGGLQLSMPLFDGRQTKTNVAKAKLQQQQAQLDLADQQKQLYQTIEGYWLDATTNQQKLQAATANVESAQASYDLLQEQFNVGLKNIAELLNGKGQLLQAQQNRLQAKYLTLLNQQLLRFYAGSHSSH